MPLRSLPASWTGAPEGTQLQGKASWCLALFTQRARPDTRHFSVTGIFQLHNAGTGKGKESSPYKLQCKIYDGALYSVPNYQFQHHHPPCRKGSLWYPRRNNRPQCCLATHLLELKEGPKLKKSDKKTSGISFPCGA